MYIKVIPFDINFTFEPITYSIDAGHRKYLDIGSIVSVPIKDNEYHSIVVGFEEESQVQNVRPINLVESSFPIISAYQIGILAKLSNKYFIGPSLLLNLFLPKYVKDKLVNSSYEDISTFEKMKASSSRRITSVISIQEKSSIYEYLVQNLADSSVIIFPDDLSIDYFCQKNKDLAADSIIFKNSHTYAKKYKSYMHMLEGKKQILIGTRKILSYNLGRYENIFYIEEAIQKDIHFKNGIYRNLDILEGLSNTGLFNLHIVSSVLSLGLLKFAKKNNVKIKTF